MRATAGQGFDVRNHLGRRWLADAIAAWAQNAPVRIRMTSAQAERLKPDWFFGAGSFERSGPDEVVMTYGEFEPEKVLELVRWLGPGAEILDPPEWREMMKAEIAKMQAAYA